MKKTFFFITLFFLLLGNFSFVHAQDVQEILSEEDTFIEVSSESEEENSFPVIRIATVNVYDASIHNQTKDSLEIAYTVHNREGVQTDIVASIALIDSGGFLAYQQKAQESFSVLVNEQKVMSEKINVPTFLQGDFDVYLVLATQAGVTLANASVGTVRFNGSGEYVQIKECSLRILEGEESYGILEGIDIDIPENLVLICSAKNSSSQKVEAIPSFVEYWRSPFGRETNTYSSEAIFFDAQQEKSIEIPLQKNDIPQSYTQLLTLKRSGNQIISNQIELHYVLRGEGATIQNIIFDKPSYRKGDMARVSFGWTGAPDNFLGARNPEGTLVSGTAVLQILDGEKECSVQQEISFDTGGDSIYIHKEIESLMDIDCLNPEISIALIDNNGKRLDERKVSVQKIDTNTGLTERHTLSLIGGLLVFLILFLGFAYRRRRGLKTALFFVTIASGIFGVSLEEIKADTFLFDPDGRAYTITANHNKAVYSPSETAKVTTSISAIACWNGWNAITGILEMVTPDPQQINKWDKDDFANGRSSKCSESFYYYHQHYECNTGLVSKDFTVPRAVGSYNADYKIIMYYFDYRYKTATGYFALPYTVAIAPTLTFTADSYSIPYNTATTLRWTSTNANICTASNAWTGRRLLSGNSGTGNLTSAKTYTLTCTGAGGSISRNVTVTVGSAPINGSCGTNARTYLSTETSYTGTFCSAGNVSPASPAFPSPGNTVSWQCQGSDGGNSPACGATRQAAPAPTLAFTADSTNISYNEATTLRWTSTNTTSCTAPNAWLLSDTPPTTKSLNGDQSTGNLTSAKTYTLRCEGVAGGSIEKSVIVNVSAQPALTLKERDCFGQKIQSTLLIENSKTIAVCEGTTPVDPASWNINLSQTAFYVGGLDRDTTRTFTAIGDDGESITIQATRTGYTSSDVVTLRVKKDPFLPPVPQKGEDQWKEIAP